MQNANQPPMKVPISRSHASIRQQFCPTKAGHSLIRNIRKTAKAMSSWEKRLQLLQSTMPPQELESLDHLTLDALKAEKVSFGKAHSGKTYEEVWSSAPEWIRWFLLHYEQSRGLEHRKMIRYIKLKIESLENGEEGPQMPVQPRAKAAPKALWAKAKSQPARGSVPEPDSPWIVDDATNSRVDQIQERMGNLENALNQILIYLTPNIPTGNATEGEMPVIPMVGEFDDPWNDPLDN